jgi:hypothetical protein
MRNITLLLLAVGLFMPVFSFFPHFHGARSLALGYSSLAFNYDPNALYLNPALLDSLSVSMGGYQYQNSYLDFRGTSQRLAEISEHDLDHFQELEAGDKAALLERLREAFSARAPICGFQSRHPCYAGKRYAISIASVDAAVIQALDNTVLDKPAEEITNADIASLRVNFIGFHYTDYALAVAFPISRGLALGATVHYLKGRNTEFNAALTAEPFRSDATAKDLLQAAWSGAESGFSRFNFDLGASMELGQYFKTGLVMKNATHPLIATALGELQLARRLVAGLAFRPDSQLGVFLDIDVSRSDLFHTGEAAQPVSMGVEKGFFQNKLFLRGGLWSDLAADYFLGRKANSLLGLGIGFHIGSFLVDLALGLDPLGRVKNMGISGFYLLR